MSQSPVGDLSRYELAHLTAHLEAAGRDKELHRLLALPWHVQADEQEENETLCLNAWYEARSSCGDVAGYLDDVARAWRMAASAHQEGDEASLPSGLNIGRLCRYALITSTHNSLAQNLSPELLDAVLQEGLWTPGQALVYVMRRRRPKQQLELLPALEPYLPPDQWQQAIDQMLAKLRQTQAVNDKIDAFLLLAPYLEEPAQLEDVLGAVVRLENNDERAGRLADLAPFLPEPMLVDAVAAAQNTRPFDQVALDRLIPCLPESILGELDIEPAGSSPYPYEGHLLAAALRWIELGRLEQARQVQGLIQDTSRRAEVWLAMLPHLDGSQQRAPIREILRAANRRNGWLHAQIILMARVSTYLSGRRRRSTLGRALSMLKDVYDPDWDAEVSQTSNMRSRALSELTPQLSLAQLETAVGQADRLGIEEWVMPPLLGRLAVLGKPDDALQRAWALRDGCERTLAVCRIAPHLAPPQRRRILAEALDLASNFVNRETRIRSCLALSSVMADDQRREAVQAALNAALVLDDERALLQLKIQTAPYLSRRERVRVADAAFRMARATHRFGNEKQQIDMLLDLIKLLPKRDRELMLRRFLSAYKYNEYSRSLDSLAPLLSPSQLHKHLLRIKKDIMKSKDRKVEQALRELKSIVPHLSPSLHESALEIPTVLGKDEHRSNALVIMAPYIPESLLDRAASLVASIENPKRRADAIIALSPRLAARGDVRTALALAQGIEGRKRRTRSLVVLAPYLSKKEKKELLKGIRRLNRYWRRRQALADLAPHLPASLLERAMAMAVDLHDGQALSIMVPHLTRKQRRKLLRVARSHLNGQEKARVLVALARQRTHQKRDAYYAEALYALGLATSETSPDNRYDVGRYDSNGSFPILKELAPALTPEQFAMALTSFSVIDDERQRAVALEAVGPHVPDSALEQALQLLPASGPSNGKAICALAQSYARLEPESNYKHWRTLLPILAAYPREDLARNLACFIPVIHILGGSAGLQETFLAVEDMERWWP